MGNPDSEHFKYDGINWFLQICCCPNMAKQNYMLTLYHVNNEHEQFQAAEICEQCAQALHTTPATRYKHKQYLIGNVFNVCYDVFYYVRL